MSEFNLATADKPSLKAYAINELDLNLSLTMNEDTMRQKILDKCDELKVEPPKSEIVLKGAANAGKKVAYVTINIAKQSKTDGTGAEPAIVGVQGVLYSIPRGINIDVPPAVVEVLKNGIQEIITQDGETGEFLKEEVPTYPFNVVAA